jgi:hypothetical protein
MIKFQGGFRLCIEKLFYAAHPYQNQQALYTLWENITKVVHSIFQYFENLFFPTSPIEFSLFERLTNLEKAYHQQQSRDKITKAFYSLPQVARRLIYSTYLPNSSRRTARAQFMKNITSQKAKEVVEQVLERQPTYFLNIAKDFLWQNNVTNQEKLQMVSDLQSLELSIDGVTRDDIDKVIRNLMMELFPPTTPFLPTHYAVLNRVNFGPHDPVSDERHQAVVLQEINRSYD